MQTNCRTDCAGGIHFPVSVFTLHIFCLHCFYSIYTFYISMYIDLLLYWCLFGVSTLWDYLILSYLTLWDCPCGNLQLCTVLTVEWSERQDHYNQASHLNSTKNILRKVMTQNTFLLLWLMQLFTDRLRLPAGFRPSLASWLRTTVSAASRSSAQ